MIYGSKIFYLFNEDLNNYIMETEDILNESQ